MNDAARVTRLLDLNDPREVEAFERGFYAGFEEATHNRLVRWLWDWDHEARRLRTRIPYADQRIWALHDSEGALTSAIAVNVALRSLQAAAYAFAVPAALAADGETGRVCEFLTFFATGEHDFGRKRRLWRELFDDLRATGFSHAVATTSPKILPVYRWMGATVVGEVRIEGEMRLFLHFDLRRTAR
jgi:hypothetical protein